MLLQRQAQAKEVARMQQLVDSRENEVIRLELAVGREVEARRAAEEQGRAAGGFDNSLDISQIEREAAEGQEVGVDQHHHHHQHNHPMGGHLSRSPSPPSP